MQSLRYRAVGAHSGAAAQRPALQFMGRSSKPSVSARAYNTDVESEPRRAPESSPGRWGAPPPPPPPPPPQAQRGGGMTPPSRREAMLMALGAGLGVLGMTAYYNSGGEEALESTLDTLLDDEDFLDAVADEVMFNEYKGNMEVVNDELDAIRAKMLDESQQMKDGAQQMGR